MAFSVSNAVALVSGANRGIGRAIVEALVERGAQKVYAGARNVDSLGDLVGDKVQGIALDVTNSDQIAAAAEAASDVNLLVNNAGVAGGAGVAIGDPGNQDEARHQMEVNYFGTLAATQAFIPILGANGGGALVNLVSVAGIVNFPLFATYSASKAALHSLTQGFRLGLGGQGTFVAGVYPGPVDTDMAAEIPMDKTSPQVVANNILDGLEAGTEDIYPDPMAVGMGAGYEESPKGLERQVAEMVAAMAEG